MNLQSPSMRAEALITALEQYGQGDYIGESISQLEHCLQAAHQASQSGARDELVIAALLHDIGQIIPLKSTKEVRMNLRDSTENVGRVGHEAIGAAYLRSLGFSETVCQLVDSHVAAKRYLTAVNKAYYDSLSSASQRSLAFQGGPFEGSELQDFETHPLRDEMVALRLWDDGAKLVGVEATTPRARFYLHMIVRHLSQQSIRYMRRPLSLEPKEIGPPSSITMDDLYVDSTCSQFGLAISQGFFIVNCSSDYLGNAR